MNRFAFVLEQTLGHVAHARNLERALGQETDIDATVIPVAYSEPQGLQRLPAIRSWSWRASVVARDGLQARMARGPLDGIFIHTQVTALKSTEIMHRVPTIVSLDATPRQFDREGAAYGHQRSAEVIEAFKRQVNMRAFAAASRLVTWCKWASYSLTAEYDVPADKIDVIPPGVDLTIFRPLLIAKGSNPVRVLFVGADFERKGGPDLVAAAQLLGDAVELDIVTASDVPAMPAGVKARVHRNLKPQSEELVSLYRRANIFAMPSRGDCMPQAVAEALGCGLPVVATKVGAIPEMVNDQQNGYLVPTRDPRALAAAIGSLVSSPSRRTALGRSSRLLAEQQFDATKNNRRIFQLMREMAGSMHESRQEARSA